MGFGAGGVPGLGGAFSQAPGFLAFQGLWVWSFGFLASLTDTGKMYIIGIYIYVVLLCVYIYIAMCVCMHIYIC